MSIVSVFQDEKGQGSRTTVCNICPNMEAVPTTVIIYHKQTNKLTISPITDSGNGQTGMALKHSKVNIKIKQNQQIIKYPNMPMAKEKSTILNGN